MKLGYMGVDLSRGSQNVVISFEGSIVIVPIDVGPNPEWRKIYFMYTIVFTSYNLIASQGCFHFVTWCV